MKSSSFWSLDKGFFFLFQKSKCVCIGRKQRGLCGMEFESLIGHPCRIQTLWASGAARLWTYLCEGQVSLLGERKNLILREIQVGEYKPRWRCLWQTKEGLILTVAFARTHSDGPSTPDRVVTSGCKMCEDEALKRDKPWLQLSSLSY